MKSLPQSLRKVESSSTFCNACSNKTIVREVAVSVCYTCQFLMQLGSQQIARKVAWKITQRKFSALTGTSSRRVNRRPLRAACFFYRRSIPRTQGELYSMDQVTDQFTLSFLKRTGRQLNKAGLDWVREALSEWHGNSQALLCIEGF